MKLREKILTLSLAMAILFLIVPSAALAADALISSGGTYNLSAYGNDSTVTIDTTDPVTLMGDATTYTNLRIIGITAGVDVTLQDVRLESGDTSALLSFTGPGNTLTLAGSNVLDSGGPGVLVESGTALIIGGAGTLDVSSGDRGAAIGSGKGKDYGDITITGGTVIATGDYSGAGIGRGASYNDAAGIHGKVEITGGTVIARGGNYAAGIGGGGGSFGGGSSNGTVIISGGTVTAIGGGGAAGIGGGCDGDGGTVHITGGTVTATGGSNYGESNGGGAGIGGGYWRGGGTVIIAGGSVHATGGGGLYVGSDIGPGGLGHGGSLTNKPIADGGVPVYVTTATVEGVSAATAVSQITTDNSEVYGTNDMKTDAGGKLYLYLPENAHIKGMQTASDQYVGWIATTTDASTSTGLLFIPALSVTGDASGYYFLDHVLTIIQSGSYTVSMRIPGDSTSTERIVVRAGTQASPVNLTLNSVDIQLLNGCALDLSGSVVHLALAGNSTIQSGISCAGVFCPVGATLVIGGTGSLTATGGWDGAGIGGSVARDFGDITINGGTVYAIGGQSAAGLGGGRGGDMGRIGTVTINGGTVNAQAGHAGAGIGGGQGGSCTVTINGGTVTAIGNSGNGGDGIGCGNNGHEGTISINGGTIIATGGWGGSGIGCGNGGTVAIDGGMINATGGHDGAGIGCGDGGMITVSDGTIMAIGGTNGPGIGCGGYPGKIRIEGGIVFVEGINNEDINAHWKTSGAGLLVFSGTVKVFHKNNSPILFDQQPPTTEASHWFFTDHTAGDSIHGIPVPWEGSFYAFLSLYTLSYDGNGGIGTLPAPHPTHLADVTVTVADGSTLSRAHYTFSGWNTKWDGSGSGYQPGDTYAFPGDTQTTPTLYAHWVPVAFPITYDLAGGTSSPENPTSYTIESAAITLVNPTKAGYAFSGWSGTDLTEITMNVTIPTGSTGSRAFTANWTEYTPRNLTDPDTAIAVAGTMDPGAVLTVGEMTLGSEPACDAIRQRMADDDYVLLLDHNISLSGGFTGTLAISLPVDSQYNGKTVTILHCASGTLQTYTATVTGGQAVIHVTSLSPFAVFAQAPANLNDGGLPDIPKVGDDRSDLIWWLLCGLSATGIAMLTMARVRKKPTDGKPG